MLDRLKVIFFCFFLILISCKKYPENNLILRNPYNVIKGVWKLQAYFVDGADSTHYPDMKIYHDLNFVFLRNGETQGAFGVKDKWGDLMLDDASNVSYMESGWSLDQKKKNISIGRLEILGSGYVLNYSGSKQLFRSNPWKIEKLNRKNFWISKTFEGVRYKIEFAKLD